MNKTKKQPSKEPMLPQGNPQILAIDAIDFSPLNYRKYFREEDLEAFAEELKVHGIISPLMVRKLPNGRYQLVAGERRLRAAKIAKLQTVPVMIQELTDEQVTEIQLAENLQRENPHPMDEAHAVKLMQDTGKTIDDIALRLGKSRQFVYVRLKLLNLIEPIREMFYGEVINVQQALEIATISQDGQTQFFHDHCIKWKQKHFQLPNLEWHLRPYKYDLRNAPFDTKNKKLLPDVGACTGCQFNSATLKSLFPEYAKQAICTNTACYMNKCAASLRIGLMNGLQIHEPVALLFNGEPSENMVEFLKQIPEAENLSRHDYNRITVLTVPEEPEQDNYTYEDDDEKEQFDKKGFTIAMREYKDELAEYEQSIKSGNYQKALLEKGGDFYPVYFNLEPPRRADYGNNGRGISMKAVQEAIKSGTATIELLDTAIEGIKEREARAKELDRDKVQLNVHKVFQESACDLSAIAGVSEADLIAARLLVYQSLDYNTRNTVDAVLFKKKEKYAKNANGAFYDMLRQLTDQQHSYLIRMALACKADSKYPGNETGITLYKVAESAGIDVAAIEKDQQEKAQARAERVKDRVKDLQKRKQKLKSKTK